jgi:hypothetical protein
VRVLVCGGRDFTDELGLCRALDELSRKWGGYVKVIHGGARGADRMAGAWALSRGHGEIVFHADWDRHDNAAGPIRNQQMLDEGKPDLVIAFAGGKGTQDMIRRSRKAGLLVLEVTT